MSAGDVLVGVADLAVGEAGATLITLGLGSCVAIILHDPGSRIGGMAHVMLPSVSLNRRPDRPGRVAHTAVPALLEAMSGAGANPRRLTARLVGGASLFTNLATPGSVQMGERNVVAAREVLHRHGIPLVRELVGGDYGRSVWFTVDDGKVLVRTAARGEHIL